jgi:hypothetical protein
MLLFPFSVKFPGISRQKEYAELQYLLECWALIFKPKPNKEIINKSFFIAIRVVGSVQLIMIT